MLVTRKSPISGETKTKDIDITEEQLASWKTGALIQDVMSDISTDDREFILTGIDKEEWDTLMTDD